MTATVTHWMRDPNRVRLSSGETLSLYDYHAHTSDTGVCYCYLCIRDRARSTYVEPFDVQADWEERA